MSKHDGKNVSIQRVIHNVVKIVHMMLKVRKPKRSFKGGWSDIL